MVTTIEKWGNSLALRIPGAFARNMRLSPGSLVEMTIVTGKMVIKPEGQSNISLSKMLKDITKNNHHPEQNYNGAVGREIF